MSAGRVVVPLRLGSDGDATHKPKSNDHKLVSPPTVYLEKIGLQWMQARGEAIPGVDYVLERLPAGYTLWERQRLSNPKHVDRWLYGHPSHKSFDSPNRFFPHFQYLMENGGNSSGCPCTVCNTKGGIMGPSISGRGSHHNGSSRLVPNRGGMAAQQPRGRPKVVAPGIDISRVDEEGTPDVYRNLIDKLKKMGSLDEFITEPMSLDWRAEQEVLLKLQKSLEKDPQWLPRAGDIVLFVRVLKDGMEVVLEPKTGQYKLYDTTKRIFGGHPHWEAGLVGQTPLESTNIDDLVVEQSKEMSVAYSGVRVEPIPDPNNTDKSLSKRYKYIPLHHTRPFVFWKEFLNGIPQDDWDFTIENALTAMSSFSLMGKYRFKGIWPEAWIYCHGIYVGSEMLAIGDTIRLLPKSDAATSTDVLKIKSIRLKLTHLDLASGNDYDEGRPYNSSVYIVGRGYTNDQLRSSKEWLSMDDTDVPAVMETYGLWHPLHPPDKEMQIPFSRILGRLFESTAMTLWFPLTSRAGEILPPDTDQGREGLLAARGYARENDQRIIKSFGSSWYWGESRAQALDLQTINGLEVGKWDLDRDPKEWRRQIKILEDEEHEQNLPKQQSNPTGMPSLRSFKAPGTQQSVSSRHESRDDDEIQELGEQHGGIGSRRTLTNSPMTVGSKKRAKVIDVSSGDYTDEDILARTKVVDKHHEKKAKTMIILD